MIFELHIFKALTTSFIVTAMCQTLSSIDQVPKDVTAAKYDISRFHTANIVSSLIESFLLIRRT